MWVKSASLFVDRRSIGAANARVRAASAERNDNQTMGLSLVSFVAVTNTNYLLNFFVVCLQFAPV